MVLKVISILGMLMIAIVQNYYSEIRKLWKVSICFILIILGLSNIIESRKSEIKANLESQKLQTEINGLKNLLNETKIGIENLSILDLENRLLSKNFELEATLNELVKAKNNYNYVKTPETNNEKLRLEIKEKLLRENIEKMESVLAVKQKRPEINLDLRQNLKRPVLNIKQQN